MSSIKLTQANQSRLQRLGLIKVSADRYVDPVTSSTYIFSPKGYCYRKTLTGQYQINPRIQTTVNYGGRKVKMTLKTTDTTMLTDYAVKAVKNSRGTK